MNKFIKTTSLFVLSAVISTGFSACSNNSPDESNLSEPAITTESSVVPEDIKNMMEPADALLMCMVERSSAYNPEDPEFFWTALHIFTGVYGSEHPLSSMTDTDMILPRQAVQEFATVLFSDYDNLLEVPDTLSDSIKYDPNTDAYSFGLGNRGASESVIAGFADNGDGTYTMEVDLKSLMDGKVISSGKFTMVPNEYADSITDATYLYSISGAEITK